MIEFFLIIFGAIFGSFANMLIYRLPREMSIGWSRSRCPHCNTTLPPSSLIPVISFIRQLGRCHACNKSIGWRYLIVELISIGIFLGPYMVGLPLLQSLQWILFLYCMLVLVISDIETMILPHSPTVVLILGSFGIHYYYGTLTDSLFGLVGGFGILFLLSLITMLIYKREAIGGGDSKMVAGIGACWGLKTTLVTLYLSFIVGGILSLILIILKVKDKKDRIPFGPSIFISTIIAYFYGDYLIRLVF